MRNFLLLAVILLCVLVVAMFTFNRSLDNKYKDAVLNLKASQLELNGSKEEVAAYKLTVSQMKYFNDSILQEMKVIQEELKIKDKNLQSVQYVPSVVTKTDTVSFIDTIFIDPSLSVDTTLRDEWYKLNLYLAYPSTVAVTPSFKSEKYILVSQRKETVGPPKKFFLFRLFQKKHTILRVDVVEKNPYIENGKGKYVEVVK